MVVCLRKTHQVRENGGQEPDSVRPISREQKILWCVCDKEFLFCLSLEPSWDRSGIISTEINGSYLNVEHYFAYRFT